MDTTWRQAFSFYDFVSEGTQQIFNENEIFFLNALVVFISALVFRKSRKCSQLLSHLSLSLGDFLKLGTAC